MRGRYWKCQGSPEMVVDWRRPLQDFQGRCFLTYVFSIAFISMSGCKLTQVNVFHCGQTVESVNGIKPIAT